MSKDQHALAHNGAAHHDIECEYCLSNRRSTHAQIVADWHGHAVCRCGTMSPHMTRNHERREWHDAHVAS